MSSIIIFAKEVTRFGEVSYYFEVECDAKKEYYSCILKKKNGKAIIETITLPFEVMELLQISVSNVSEYLLTLRIGHCFCLFPTPSSYMLYLRKHVHMRTANILHYCSGACRRTFFPHWSDGFWNS